MVQAVKLLQFCRSLYALALMFPPKLSSHRNRDPNGGEWTSTRTAKVPLVSSSIAADTPPPLLSSPLPAASSSCGERERER
jgi:hypothetical protein